MTKETKIGLLVGLAFIILFAIILSGNGATRGTASPNAISVADAAGAKGAPTGAEKPLHNEGRLPVEAQLPPVVRGTPPVPANVLPPKEKPVEGRTTSDGGLGTAVPPSVVEYLNQPVDGDDEDRDARPRAGETQETVPLRDAVTSALEETEKVLAQKTEQGKPGEPPKAPGTSGAESAESAQGVNGVKGVKGAKGATVHAVQPGESLGKIAAKYYGRSTPERIEAIFDANRDVLKDKQKVKASDKLKIPALEGYEDEFEAAPGFPAANMKSPHEIQRDGLARIPQPVGETPVAAAETPKRRNAETSKHGDRGVPATSLQSRDHTSRDHTSRDHTSRDHTSRDRQGADAPKTVTETSSGGPGPQPGAAGPHAEPGPANVRWYEVKKSDTLSTIAQRELGSSRRYQEIYELNKDVIRDRDRLKAGMKIRLPEKTASSARPEPSEPGKTKASTAQSPPGKSRGGRTPPRAAVLQ